MTIGEYDVAITVSLAAGPAGIGITITGTATRSTAGTQGLLVEGGVDGSATSLVPVPSVALVLDGTATGTSRTQLGGGLGYPTSGGPGTPAGDVLYTPINVGIDELTFGRGPSILRRLLSHSGQALSRPSPTSLSRQRPPASPSPSRAASSSATRPFLHLLVRRGGRNLKPHFECYSVDKHPAAGLHRCDSQGSVDSVEARLGDIVRICHTC